MEKLNLKGKDHEVKYLREEQHGRRGELTIAYIELENGTQMISVAERSPKDPYDEKLAREVAFGRLEKKVLKRNGHARTSNIVA
jgi:hypothetical protein